MHAEIICMSRGKHVAILLQNLTTMKELTALQDKDKDKGLGLGKYNSAAQSITPSYIYMVVKLSLSLCPGLSSFDNHIIIQLAFLSLSISPDDSLLGTTCLEGYLSGDILLDFKG